MVVVMEVVMAEDMEVAMEVVTEVVMEVVMEVAMEVAAVDKLYTFMVVIRSQVVAAEVLEVRLNLPKDNLLNS